MSEPDDRLENFIRKGLGQPEFAFREEDWALMEAKLAAMPVPVSSWKKLRWWLLGSVLFFVAFFSGWIMKEWMDNTIQNPSKEFLAETNVSTATIDSTPTLDLNQTNAIVDDCSVEEIESKEIIASTPSISKRNLDEVINSLPVLGEDESSETLYQPKVQALADANESLNLHNLNKQAWSLWRLQSKVPDRKIRPYRANPFAEEEREDTPKKPNHFHAALGLMISPDFTGTTIKKGFESMGQTYGLGLEFYTGPKFRLKLSAIQTEKIYTAGKGEYTIPGSGYYGIEPERTDAVCDILEVPIFFQYNIWNQGRNSIWLSNGLSSYWMQREDYQYTYSSSGPYPESLSIQKENKHLFSVVSVGFAYERQLNKYLSMELEPYLKIPLGGVGYGKVSLYTTGAYFSIKYHLRR